MRREPWALSPEKAGRHVLEPEEAGGHPLAALLAILIEHSHGNSCANCRDLPGQHCEGDASADPRHEPFSAATLSRCAITMLDFETAIPKVQPSVRREGFATTPDVTWQDVGALPQVRIPLHALATAELMMPLQMKSGVMQHVQMHM